MLMMVGDTDIFQKYGEVHFVIGHSDTWSERKVRDFYKTHKIDLNQDNLKIHRIFRAREVKQSFVTSIFTTLVAAVHALWIVTVGTRLSVDLVLTNGPGTAVPLCYCYWFVSKVLLFNLKAKIIFIESFCRVKTLSLTAKLLRPILSKFVVQWEELHKKYPNDSLLFKDKII